MRKGKTEKGKKKVVVNVCKKASIFPSDLTTRLYIDYWKTEKKLLFVTSMLELSVNTNQKQLALGNLWDDICAWFFLFLDLWMLSL